MAPVELMEPQLAPALVDDASEMELFEDELLIEEISIDGMCGVY
jgi:mycofactocin precursor